MSMIKLSEILFEETRYKKETGENLPNWQDKLKEYEKEKKNESKTDRAFDKFRNPIIAAILFFILHMPIVNTMIFKQFSFLSIYNDDGNFNFYGLVLKAAIFGFIYWFIESALDYLGEI